MIIVSMHKAGDTLEWSLVISILEDLGLFEGILGYNMSSSNG